MDVENSSEGLEDITDALAKDELIVNAKSDNPFIFKKTASWEEFQAEFGSDQL